MGGKKPGRDPGQLNLLKPLLYKQAISIGLGKTLFKPPPNFSFATMQLIRVRKLFYF
jgi:hypothetical protein